MPSESRSGSGQDKVALPAVCAVGPQCHARTEDSGSAEASRLGTCWRRLGKRAEACCAGIHRGTGAGVESRAAADTGARWGHGVATCFSEGFGRRPGFTNDAVTGNMASARETFRLPSATSSEARPTAFASAAAASATTKASPACQTGAGSTIDASRRRATTEAEAYAHQFARLAAASES